MKKIYILGPMTGLIDYNRASFRVAEAWFVSQGYSVRTPSILPDGWSRSEYIATDMTILSFCDAVARLPGWENSEGAQDENDEATENGLPAVEIPPHVMQMLLELYQYASAGRTGNNCNNSDRS